MLRPRFALLLIGLLAACIPFPVPVPVVLAPSQPADSRWQVIKQTPITLSDARILALSPNGQWLAAQVGKQLCIYAVAALVEPPASGATEAHRCIELPGGPFDSRGVAWSPDSTHLALTENLLLYFFESDLYLFNVVDGQLSNLTDDNARGDLLDSIPNAQYDALPAWSPDGETLAFARINADRSNTMLYRIDRTGGEPERLRIVTPDAAFTIFYHLRWVGANEILYTIGYPEITTPANGVWRIDADGSRPRQLAGWVDDTLGYPFLIEANARRRQALLWYYLASTRRGNVQPATSPFALLELDSGEIEFLRPTPQTATEFFTVYNATYSPDGTNLLYSYTDAELQPHLVVRNLLSGAESSLVVEGEGTFGEFDIGQGLNWASNNTIWVATRPQSGILLTLSPAH